MPRTLSDTSKTTKSPHRFDPAEDLALIRAFQADDPMATAELEKRLEGIPRILAALNRRLGRPLDSEELADISQDTAVIVLRKLSDYGGGAPFAAWMYRVCGFELRNAIRRKQRKPMLMADGDVQVVDQEDEMGQLVRRELVLSVLEKIRDADAEAVRLHHFDGLTFVETAERLGVSLNIVKGRYYRGIQQLHGLLRGAKPRAVERPA